MSSTIVRCATALVAATALATGLAGTATGAAVAADTTSAERAASTFRSGDDARRIRADVSSVDYEKQTFTRGGTVPLRVVVWRAKGPYEQMAKIRLFRENGPFSVCSRSDRFRTVRLPISGVGTYTYELEARVEGAFGYTVTTAGDRLNAPPSGPTCSRFVVRDRTGRDAERRPARPFVVRHVDGQTPVGPHRFAFAVFDLRPPYHQDAKVTLFQGFCEPENRRRTYRVAVDGRGVYRTPVATYGRGKAWRTRIFLPGDARNTAAERPCSTSTTTIFGQ